MKDVTTDLCDRLSLLRLRYNTAFGAPAPLDSPHSPYRTLAEALEIGLREGSEVDAARVRAIVDPADLDSSGFGFWGSSLGRLLFAAGGFRAEACTQTVAAAVLGCSRQYVHALITSGKVRSETGLNPAARQVHTGDVRDLLNTKIDKLVK